MQWNGIIDVKREESRDVFAAHCHGRDGDGIVYSSSHPSLPLSNPNPRAFSLSHFFQSEHPSVRPSLLVVFFFLGLFVCLVILS